MLTTVLMYALASLAVTVIPGPTMLLALTNGVSKSKKVILMGVAGAALSDFILIGMVALGLGSLLLASNTLFSVVKWLGAGYLFWLSWKLWRSTPAMLKPLAGEPVTQRSGKRAFMRSLLAALSNPKGLLFFSAFLPQFIIVNHPLVPQYVAFACTTVAIDVAIMLLYAFGGMQAARLLTVAGLKRLNRISAALMFFLAGGLAVWRRN